MAFSLESKVEAAFRETKIRPPGEVRAGVVDLAFLKPGSDIHTIPVDFSPSSRTSSKLIRLRDCIFPFFGGSVWRDGIAPNGCAERYETVYRYDLIDDHVPLLDAGIPAVDIIDFDYPAWHTVSDLPDRVSAASLAEVSRVAAWIVYQSALAHD